MSSESANNKSPKVLRFTDELVSVEFIENLSSITDGETTSKSDTDIITPKPLTPSSTSTHTFPNLSLPGTDSELKVARSGGDLALYFPIEFELNRRKVECYFFAYSTSLGKYLGPATRFTGYPHAFGKGIFNHSYALLLRVTSKISNKCQLLGNNDCCTILAFSLDHVGQIIINFTLDKLSTPIHKLKVYQDYWSNVVAHADLSVHNEITDYITDSDSIDRIIKHSADILVMKAKAGAIWYHLSEFLNIQNLK